MTSAPASLQRSVVFCNKNTVVYSWKRCAVVRQRFWRVGLWPSLQKWAFALSWRSEQERISGTWRGAWGPRLYNKQRGKITNLLKKFSLVTKRFLIKNIRWEEIHIRKKLQQTINPYVHPFLSWAKYLH